MRGIKGKGIMINFRIKKRVEKTERPHTRELYIKSWKNKRDWNEPIVEQISKAIKPNYETARKTRGEFKAYVEK